MNTDEYLYDLYTRAKSADFDEFKTLMSPYIIDKLTGFYDRQYYENQLPFIQESVLKSVKESSEDPSKKGYTLLFADINNLKKTNDTKGYETANNGIRNIVGALKSNLSSFDNVSGFRIGGDEFVIHIPNSSRTDLIGPVKNIEKEISDNKELLNNMSISIGIVDTKEIVFTGFDKPKAKEYVYMLVNYMAVIEMQKRKKEIKYGDIDAVDYARDYFKNTIEYLFRALAIQNPDESDFKLIKQYMTDALSDIQTPNTKNRKPNSDEFSKE